MFVAEILKFLGAVLSAGVAIFATRTDGIKSAHAGQLTKTGKTIVFLAICGVAVSGAAQLFQLVDVLNSAERNRERQEKLTNRLENVSFQSIRQYYPLEPIAIVFELEYSMDDPALSSYVKSLKEKIYHYLVAAREGRGKTSRDLDDEKGVFNLFAEKDWLPTERIARFNLLSDSTTFSFQREDTGSDIRFISAKEGEEKVLVSLPQKGNPKQKISLYADFRERVFVKEVSSQNPLRIGTDISSISSLDLIGRKLKWSPGKSILPAEANVPWRLKRVGFIFPYDYDKRSTVRQINSTRTVQIPQDTHHIIITPDHIGLTDVIDTLSLREYFEKWMRKKSGGPTDGASADVNANTFESAVEKYSNVANDAP